MAHGDTGTVTTRRRGALSRPAAVAALVVLGTAGDQVFDPEHSHVPLCPFHAVTGLWCPLCGGLRSAYALGRLDLATAIRDNLLLVVALPFLIAYWIDWLRRDRIGLTERRLPRAAVQGLWFTALVFGVLRNLPACRHWLAPT